MDLVKRDCDIKMELIPKGAGWLHVHLNIGEDNLVFIVSSALGDRFEKLLRVMYHLYPENNDPEFEDDIYSWDAVCELTDNGYEVVDIVERVTEEKMPCVCRDVPYMGDFVWDEEGSESKWVIEREPTLDTDFTIKIKITIDRDETSNYCYEVKYKDFCYAIAKACTETIKNFGVLGYHHSTYEEDIPLRYFLFLKAIALDRLDLLELTELEQEKYALTSSLEKELELLLFDM